MGDRKGRNSKIGGYISKSWWNGAENYEIAEKRGTGCLKAQKWGKERKLELSGRGCSKTPPK